MNNNAKNIYCNLFTFAIEERDERNERIKKTFFDKALCTYAMNKCI